MDNHLVTCGFATFNSEKTIIRALISALNQDYKNIELLIVDDNSTDNTIKKIESFLSNKNIMYKIIKHQENLGVAQSRNTLLKYANGEFLAFFDSDDVSYKRRISKQISLIEEFEIKYSKQYKPKMHSPICYSDREIFFKNNNKIYCKAMFIKKEDFELKKELIGSLLFCNPFPSSSEPGSTATCMLCARKKTLKILNGFNPSLRRYEDLDLAIRALNNNIPLCRIDEPLVKQFYTEDNYKKNEYRYELRLIYLHSSFLKNCGLYKFAIYYVKLKKNILSFNIKKSLYYFILIFLENPKLFFKKLNSSLRTIFFTLEKEFIKKSLRN